MMSERLGRWVVGAGVRRLQPDVLPDASARAAGHAAAHLHLPARDGLGRHEPVRQPQRAGAGRGFAAVLRRRGAQRAARTRRPATIPGTHRHSNGRRRRRRPATTSTTSRSSRAPNPLWDEPARSGRDRDCAWSGASSSSARVAEARPEARESSPRTRSGRFWRRSRPA